MQKKTVLFQLFSWVVLITMLFVQVTPAAGAPLVQGTGPTALVTSSETTRQAVPLDVSSDFTISGKVTDAQLKPMAGVTIQDNQGHSMLTGEDGTYVLSGLTAGTYEVAPALPGTVFVPFYRVVKVTDKNASEVNFHQQLLPAVERQTPEQPALVQTGPVILQNKEKGKLWSPPSIEEPQPAGGELQAQAAFSLGQPGLVYRYSQTLGTTEEGYAADDVHVNGPAGVFVDGSSNLFIAEGRGKRLLEYDSSYNQVHTKGKPGVSYYANDVFFDPKDVAIDEGGNVWLVEPNRLVEYGPTWSFIRQFPATDPGTSGSGNDRFTNPEGIAFGDGYMFVADKGNQRVQVFTFPSSAPVYSTTIGETGVAGKDNGHFDGPAHLAFYDHALYVTDQNNNRFMKCVVSDFSCTPFDLSGDPVFHPAPGVDTPLKTPTGISFGPSQIYVSDAGNYRVIACNLDGTNCTHFAGTAGEKGTDADHFQWVSDVAADAGGYVYISDYDNHRVQVFDTSSTPAILNNTFGSTSGLGEPEPYLPDDTHFNGPSGVVTSVEDTTNFYLYISENGGRRLVKYDPAGSVVWPVGSAGVYGSDDAHFGSFWTGPTGTLGRDSMGRIFVPDTGNQRVQVYLKDGSLWGSLGVTGVSGSDNFHFNQPEGVAIGSNDDIYVADAGNARIQVYDWNHNYKATLGVSGVPGSDASHFNWPMGIALDPSGNIYVADTGNQRVQKCTLSGSSGICVPFAGKTGVSAAGFDYLTSPTSVIVASGEVYIVDSGRNRVLVFDLSGAYRTSLAGDWGTRSGDLRQGIGIGVSQEGDVYVADQVNQRIQEYVKDVPAWNQLTLNGFGAQYRRQIQAVEPFGTSLYMAPYNLKSKTAELYRMDSNGNLSIITTNGFGNSQNEGIDDLVEFGGKLYASTWNTTGGQVWNSTDGTTWTQVTLPSEFDASNPEIYQMALFNSKLYIGTSVYGASAPSHGAQVWSYDPAATPTWEKVFEASDVNTHTVVSFAVKGDYLYAGMANDSAGGELYRCSTTACSTGDWVNMFTAGNGNGDANSTSVDSLAVFTITGTEYLFAGLANAHDGVKIYQGDCGVSGCTWSLANTAGFGSAANAQVPALKVYDSKLLAITANQTTGLQIKAYDGATWSAYLADDGFGNSTNQTIYSCAAAAIFQSRLVLGTTNMSNGAGVWATDPSMHKITGTINGIDSSHQVNVFLYKNGEVVQTTATQRDYTFDSVPDGVYTVMPISGNYSFDPALPRTVTVAGSDVPVPPFSAAFHELGLLNPVDGTQLDGQSVKLEWSNQGVKSYEYQVAYDTTFKSLYKHAKLSATSITLNSLPFGKTFYWHVRDTSTSTPGPWSGYWSFTTPNPPSIPILLTPLVNAVLPGTLPTFTWRVSTGAPDHYRVQVSQTTTFTKLDLDENTNGAVTSYTVEGGLNPNRIYYWRVQSVNASGDSNSWSIVRKFSTLPAVPILVSPAANATASSLSPLFQWNDSLNTGAAYQIQILLATTSAVFKTANVSDKFYLLTSSLVAGRQYKWQVRTRGLTGFSNWSEQRLLTAPNPPGPTTLVTPLSNAAVTNWQPVFTWQAVGTVPLYNLQISPDNQFLFNNLRLDRFVVGAVTYDMSTNPTDKLTANTTYYWRVAACTGTIQSYQCSAFTSARRFYTKPGVPQLLAPADAAYGSSLGADFSWGDQPLPASPINSKSTTIEITKTAGCAAPIVRTATLTTLQYSTTLSAGTVPDGTTYYWHVRAVGVGGTAGVGDWSECRSIKIQNPPALPILTAPASSLEVPDYRSIAFTWQVVTGATGYQLQVGTSSTFASLVLDKDDIITNSWTEDGLTSPPTPPYIWGGGTYFWRVRAKNVNDLWGKWSSYRRFTTLSTVYGYVWDVKAGAGLDGATVKVIQGTATPPSIDTYDQGYYILHNIKTGSSKVEVSKTGFITRSEDLTVAKSSQNQVNFGIVPVPAADTYSIVLTWPAAYSRNLDIHLWTPTGPYRSHIFPTSPGSIDSEPFVRLDAADNEYYTEVVTLDRHQMDTGHYVFAVNQSYVYPTYVKLAGSKAKVQIYDDTGALVAGPYTAPLTGSGSWWNVLTFDKADGTDLNFMSTGGTPPTMVNKIQTGSPAPWTGDEGIYGMIRLNAPGRGFAGIDVTIDGSPNAPTTTAKTDSRGYFAVGGLPVGIYKITPTYPGYTVTHEASGEHFASVEITTTDSLVWNWTGFFKIAPDTGTHTGGKHRAITVQGHFVYMTSGSGLDIINIAYKDNPMPVKRFMPSLSEINDMALAGNQLYLATASGLDILDISNPEQPYEIGYYLQLGGPTGVAISGNYAYLAYGWGDLFIFDISHPNAPQYVSEYHIPGFAEKLAVSGNYVYLAYGDTGAFRGMYVVNVKNPASPYGVGYAFVSGYPIDIAVSGNYAYMVGGVSYDYVTGTYTGGRINVFDISKPSAIKQVTEISLTDPVYDIYLEDGYAYLANGPAGLKIYDIHDPKHGVTLSGSFLFPTDGAAYCIYKLDDFGFMGNEANLRIVDISNKAVPVKRGAYEPGP